MRECESHNRMREAPSETGRDREGDIGEVKHIHLEIDGFSSFPRFQ